MTPTNELRFVERDVETTPDGAGGFMFEETIRVLQQKWVGDEYTLNNKPLIKTEWRDVPLVKEE